MNSNASITKHVKAVSTTSWLFAFLLLLGCEPQDPGSHAANPYLGVMADHSYGGLVSPGATVRRQNAKGKPVSMSQFAGNFVWADYAATWCQPCVPQSQAIASLEKSFSNKITYLTIMTSKGVKYNDVPDVSTAKTWANRFGLNPDHVLVATNLWSRTIPQHILFSPEGQMLHKSTGGLTAAQIQTIATRYREEWTAWKQTGTPAPWMK